MAYVLHIFMGILTLAGGLFVPRNMAATIRNNQTAIVVGSTVTVLPSGQAMAINSVPTLALIDPAPDLLPAVTVPFSITMTPTMIKALLQIQKSIVKKPITPQPTSTVATAPTSTPKSVVVAAPVAVKPVAKTPATLQAVPLTAQWLLDNTKTSFKQNRDGTYKAYFSAVNGTQVLSWGVHETIPNFNFTITCDPPFETPGPDSPDQTPFLRARVSYNCTMSFAATTGSDQRLFSKKVMLATGAGQLVVKPPSSANTVLANDTNNGSLVFENQDTNPVTVTKMIVDISYVGVSNMNGPLVFRVLDPAKNTSLFDYHMENFAAAGSLPYSFAESNIEIPLSFTVPAMSQKSLPIQVLGVHRLSVEGYNPKVSVVARSVTIGQTEVPVIINAAEVRWSCEVTLAPYDPNATSGPWATGTACR